MALRWIKKSVIQNIANKLKGRDPSISSVQGNQIATKISELEMVQAITPNKALSNANTSYTIPKGRNTGGVVSVSAETRQDITLKTSTTDYTAHDGMALVKLVVPALDSHPVVCGLKNPGANASVTISGVNFDPVGFYMGAAANTGGSASKYAIAGILMDQGTTYGVAEYSSSASRVIGSCSASRSGTNYTISNIKATDNSACKFRNINYFYAVWG